MTTATEINTGLSDLFFNYEHSAYDALFTDADEAPSESDKRVALLESAKDFAASIEQAFGVILDPADLVSNFVSRV